MHVSPSQICALVSRSNIAIENGEVSILSSLLWMLEDSKKLRVRLRHYLNVPSYDEPMGEAIP